MSDNSLSRRRFLEVAGAALALSTTSPLWLRLGSAGAEPAPPSGRKLLLILLEGGNDGLNTVVPYGHPAYFEKRRTLAYEPEQIIRLPDSTSIGLAPTLPKLAKLYEARKVGIVQGVGYDDPNLSHFESMDIWQTGRPKHDMATGWLGRYLDRSPAGASVVRAVAIGNRLPTALVGGEQSGVAVPSFNGFTFPPRSRTGCTRPSCASATARSTIRSPRRCCARSGTPCGPCGPSRSSATRRPGRRPRWPTRCRWP
jgi:uncharacterized protein (DUF1501 family)